MTIPRFYIIAWLLGLCCGTYVMYQILRDSQPTPFEQCVKIIHSEFDISSITVENSHHLLQIINACDAMNSKQ